MIITKLVPQFSVGDKIIGKRSAFCGGYDANIVYLVKSIDVDSRSITVKPLNNKLDGVVHEYVYSEYILASLTILSKGSKRFDGRKY